MKVYQVITDINQESGGPSYTVPALCTRLSDLNVDLELNVLGESVENNFNFKVLAHKRLMPRKLGVSPDLKRHLIKVANQNDIIHTHGLWMMPNIYPSSIVKKTGSKLVLTPRGMLSPWSLKRNGLLKKFVGYMGQYNTIMSADCLHVTAESEYQDARSFGYKGAISVIPNGVDFNDKALTSNFIDKKQKKIIFISRVHPKKGIELLLKAWSNLSAKYQDWELIVCGPGDADYVDKIKSLIAENPDSRASYQEPVYGEEKEEFYSSASIFVLPTFNENFGVVVAEALSYAVPVIVSKGAPWGKVIEKDCGWWIDNDVDVLTKTLNEAIELPKERLFEMGMKGREWMMEDFSWEMIGNKMLQTYQWLQNPGDKPDFIRLD